MLVLALLLSICAMCANAESKNFTITSIDVPIIVPPEEQFVELECRYDADFTIFSWFRGNREFFRYTPGETPSIRSWNLMGVETVEMISCGPENCTIKLGGLSPEATGVYKCELERDKPPYQFASKAAHMDVHRNELRKPLLEGLAKEYKDGDTIQAYCRGEPSSELRWYINGVELLDFRGKTNLYKQSNRLLFKYTPRTMTVQCAEFKYGRIYSSISKSARWCEETTSTASPVTSLNKAAIHKDVNSDKDVKVIVLCNKGSTTITGCFNLVSILLYLLAKVLFV